MLYRQQHRPSPARAFDRESMSKWKNSVKVLGPRLMENRKPFQLKNTLIVYNFVQVVFSAWLFYECLMGGWWGEYSFRCQPVDHGTTGRAMRIGVSGWLTGHYNFRCQPVDYSNHPKTLRMVHACWWYYFSKFTEFFDTVAGKGIHVQKKLPTEQTEREGLLIEGRLSYSSQYLRQSKIVSCCA
uniref:Elongation of very long chain fatty acids protein n=1 Tax=Anopheles melas TaxID=34690 RepID=A0A182TUC0_9DIPT